MKSMTAVVALAAAFILGSVAVTLAANSKKPVAESKKSGTVYDTKPGPAFQTVDGKLNKIDGNIYIVEDYSGKEMRLYVSKDTKKVRGEKKPGDSIRAEITKGGHANSIQ
jgi:hypothetical protein